jgi:hypothetical protein
MKIKFYLLLIISLIGCTATKQSEQAKVNKVNIEIPVINATSEKVDIYDGGNWSRGNWTLSPDLKPDIYKTKVNGENKKVSFYTDMDSITFIVEPKKTYDFIILLNKKDSCFHQINTIPNFEFSPAYIEQNKGQYSFEIPEVQELVHILFAISPAGKKDSNMVAHNSEYYNEVINHFDKYSSDKIVNELDSLLQKAYYWYHVLKMDACGFYFDDNQIKKDSIYKKMSWDGPNFIEPYIEKIQDFAVKSNFRQFYKEHTPYYESLKKMMNSQTPIDKQWKWVEKQFDLTYDNYRITFSPLVNASHSTNRFVQNDFKQTVMFICGPIEDESMSNTFKEGLMTRVVFTEIDHNYVNPISDKYLSQIEEALTPLSDWATKETLKVYGNTYSVFNEYMTWSVFTAYALDNYDKKDFEKINERVELQMSDWRGFTKFKDFNQYFIKLYRNKKADQTIEDLYPEVINWFTNR